MANMNEVIRQGFGRQPKTASEERKQSGLKLVSELSVEELVEEQKVAVERAQEVVEELALRVPDEEEEELSAMVGRRYRDNRAARATRSRTAREEMAARVAQVGHYPGRVGRRSPRIRAKVRIG